VAPPTDPLPHYFNHRADYDLSHIPGAAFVDWVREITDPDDPHHAQIAKPDRYAAAMSRAGIAENSFVVAYDDAQGMFAARLWWSLNYYGHTQVAVLDGGWQKWLAEGRPVTSAASAIPPTPFVARPRPEWKRTAAQVLHNLPAFAEGQKLLLDARSPAEFGGQASRAKRAGHIPGASNLPRTALNNPDGTLLPADQLRAKFEALGVREDSEVVTYCNGGVSASYALLALRIAGFGNSANYDGSWKEWGNDETKPMA
jgi:thiosulfate/3-mercaptopyruvate sulfurtransferase